MEKKDPTTGAMEIEQPAAVAYFPITNAKGASISIGN